jgi:multidrug resistance efflux pump
MNDTRPDYRVARWFAGLGVLSLVGSFLVVMLAAAPPTLPQQPPAGGEKKPGIRPVSVAFVDVESLIDRGGVRKLYPTRPGRVTAVPFAEGAPVKEGDVLLQVDDTLAKKELAEAKLALEAARLRLKAAKSGVERIAKQKEALREAVNVQKADQREAEAGLSKLRAYVQGGIGGSKDDVPILEAKVEKAKAGVRAKQAELEALEAVDPQDMVNQAELDVKAKTTQVEKAEYGVEECTIKAPVAGSLLRTLVSVGETLGTTPQQPALWFCPNGPRIIRAEVDQEFATTRMRVGQVATIRDDATGGGNWKGKVIRVSDWYTQRRSPLLEPMQFNDVRTLEVILSVEPKADEPLRIGQRMLVTLD